MSFIWSSLLYLLLVVPLLVLVFQPIQKQRREAAARFGSFGVLHDSSGNHSARRQLSAILFLIGITILILSLARPIGVATFIENDFGTSSAQDLIFRARWFELLLVLFGGTIIANLFRFRLVQQKKWASLIFHSAIIIIIISAGGQGILDMKV